MKVLIVDDHILFAEGIKSLLSSYENETETLYASDFDEALKIINIEGLPDLILLDINLSETNGLTLIKKFQKLNIWSPILIISASESFSILEQALQEGALGFVSKASDSITLLHAINTVMKGDIYTPCFEPTPAKGSLTSRQFEILCLLSEGLLNKQIANKLDISTNTVKAHLHDIFKYFNVSTRTAAVQSAYKSGLL